MRRAPRWGLVALTGAAVAALVVVGPGVLREPHVARPPRLVHQATAAEVSATRDHFGIDYLEPTLPRGTYWVSRWSGRRGFDGIDPQDPWFDADHGSGASYRVRQGELSISGPVPRMFVHDPHLERQWRDVEITMYFRRVADRSVPYAGMTAVARSNHLADSPACDTRGYGARIRYDGRTDFEKETAHPMNDVHGQRVIWRDGMPRDVWIGYKFLVFDEPDGVHLQTWTDLTDGRGGGDWTLANEMTDDGNVFGSKACAPRIDPRLALTAASDRAGSESGRPNVSVYFRTDGLRPGGLVYKWGSIREIRPR